MDIMMNIYILGWIVSVVLFLYIIFLWYQKKAVNKSLLELKTYHEKYVLKQIIDLRKICHNINTPVNSITTVFDIFKLELYGPMPQEYVLYAEGARQAINDLQENIQDIKSYCDYYAQTQKISIKDIPNLERSKINNPYIVNQ
jgi:hypothetical protein